MNLLPHVAAALLALPLGAAACAQVVVGPAAAPPGAQAVPVNPQQRRYGIGMAPPQGGEEYLTVLAVPEGNVAAEAGLQVNDRIVSVNGTSVSDLAPDAFGAAMRGSPLTLVVDRAGDTLTFEMSLDEAPAAAEEAARADYNAVALSLADELASRYLFPNVAGQYADMLRANVAAGAYDDVPSNFDFAQRVSADLAAVSEDRHLRVFPPGFESPGTRAVRGEASDREITDFVPNSGWLTGDVALLQISLMPPDPNLSAWASTFMEEHADARALILDLRECRGGTTDMMNAFLPYLYGAETHLLNMEVRADTDAETVAEFDADPTLVRTESDDGLITWAHTIQPSATANRPDMPVYVLTGRTGSACEHLTLALKATDRATVIGGVTGGAGHFAAMADLAEDFTALMPFGRTFDPETGVGWEGTGVAPHIEVNVDDAEAEALRLIEETDS